MSGTLVREEAKTGSTGKAVVERGGVSPGELGPGEGRGEPVPHGVTAIAPLAVVGALFLTAHGLLHVYDTLRGALDSTHWWLDLPGVYVPAVLMTAAAITLVRRESRSTP